MIPSVILGFIAVAFVVFFLRWYASAKTEDVKRTLRWTGIIVGGLVIAALIATGRMGAALAGLAGLAAWAWRVFNMIQVGRQFASMFRGLGGIGGARAAGPKSSTVEAAFLRMTLDHDSGAMDGAVVKGAFAGRALGSLSRAELDALRAECAGDPDSLALVEAYLDRTHPDWRFGTGGEAGPSPPPSPPGGTMTAEEAYRVLGLAPGAGDDDVKSAYRRLMAQLHPDKGGSDYLAAKINAAKDTLLKSAKK
ncbi:MAG: DnaJ domain-containing protein [Rhodospirillaceae bacterium]|nr:DnaJ domain-containing protein [Rhodospirillaceae bacterium]